MKATFENSVDVLVKAYMNGTLMHGDCERCAVAVVDVLADIHGIDLSTKEDAKKLFIKQ